MNTENKLIELENILSFLGIEFIYYKGHITSNGHKTAKTIGEIKEFFGKEVMTSGQFIKDIDWWDFENDWNDLKILLQQILNISYSKEMFNPNNMKRVEIFKNINVFSDKAIVYNSCLEFIKWYNQQNK